MRKGELTRAAILDVALELASRDGLEGLTIGLLADKMNMSKSGVFAHFGSREDLQIEVFKLYHHHFEQEVFYPSMKEPRGLPRLQSDVRALDQAGDGGNRVRLHLYQRRGRVRRPARRDPRRTGRHGAVHGRTRCCAACSRRSKCGHLQRRHRRRSRWSIEMYGLVLALHHDARFLQRPRQRGPRAASASTACSKATAPQTLEQCRTHTRPKPLSTDSSRSI